MKMHLNSEGEVIFTSESTRDLYDLGKLEMKLGGRYSELPNNQGALAVYKREVLKALLERP